MSTTQTPSKSSSQLVGDADKQHTPFRTPPKFPPTSFTHEFIQSLGNKLAVIFVFLQFLSCEDYSVGIVVFTINVFLSCTL